MHYFAFALEMKEPGINIISHDNLCQLPVTKVAIRQFNKRIIDYTNRNMILPTYWSQIMILDLI